MVDPTLGEQARRVLTMSRVRGKREALGSFLFQFQKLTQAEQTEMIVLMSCGENWVFGFDSTACTPIESMIEMAAHLMDESKQDMRDSLFQELQ